MSTRSPQKKPTAIPSFLPLIKPKEETTIMSRLGTIPAKESDWNTVDWSRKQIAIIRNKTIFLLIQSPFCPE
jgi:hypothetical protein